MFNEDEDDILTGSPKSKFFDIVFNANRNLVSLKLEEILEKYVAMEQILGANSKNEQDIQKYIFENPDLIHQHTNNLYIDLSGDILSQNE